jgi:sugar-specific transcriptional regulator TrmB
LAKTNAPVHHLRALGLSQSEAELYYACLSSGGGDAKLLAQGSGVPYGKVYSALKKLVERGWLVETEGHPKKYSPRPPREAIRIHRNFIDSQFAAAEKAAIEELEPLFEAQDPADRPQVWVISGMDKIVAKAMSMIFDAEREIEIALPTLPSGFEELVAIFRKKVESSPVKLRLLTSAEVARKLADSYPSDTEVRVVDKLFGGGIIADKSGALIFLGGNKSASAIWAKHSALADIADTYFAHIWSNAKPASPQQPKSVQG